jgi:2-(1,2-epoxy-1,2-dihydrophenyl)acetyl-CoA isomerase
VVLAARSATFVQAFAKIGLVPDCGGTWFLPRLVGPARARGLALTGDPLSAEQAEAWGLIWKMHDDLVLMAEAHRLCVHFTEAPTVALALIKRLLDESWANDLDSQLDLERETQREASLTPDYAEGMRAFFEKRAPAFSGRKSSSRPRAGKETSQLIDITCIYCHRWPWSGYFLRGGIWMSSARRSLLRGASMNLSFTASR